MTDAPMITLAVAILAIFAGSLFNNSRIGDMGKRFDDVRRHIDDKFALLSHQMKTMEDDVMRLLGDMKAHSEAGAPRHYIAYFRRKSPKSSLHLFSPNEDMISCS
jgi:hypothetical protein